MKNMKTRLAAAACAAISTVCSMQAISASAWQQFYYTTNTQTECDQPYFMGQAQKRWARDYGINGGSTWNPSNYNVTSGTICGEGYSRYTQSTTNLGSPLYGSQAFCRFLAHSYFGTKTFMEKEIYGSTPIKQGDQIKIDKGNQTRTLFVIYVDNINPNTLDTFSLDSSNHIQRETWERDGYYLKQGSTKWMMDFTLRPIKEGDVNGDGLFNTFDFLWLKNNVGREPSEYPKTLAQAGINSTYYRDDVFARAVWANDWKIEYSTYYTIGYNLNNPVSNNTGHMTGNHGYVKMTQNG